MGHHAAKWDQNKRGNKPESETLCSRSVRDSCEGKRRGGGKAGSVGRTSLLLVASGQGGMLAILRGSLAWHMAARSRWP